MRKAEKKNARTGRRGDILIYLDNAATSFIKPKKVYDAVAEAFGSAASPGRGGYSAALKASEILYGARESIAGLINAPSPENIVFTDNATTAINTALKGLIKKGDTFAISGAEHNAVARPSKKLSDNGANLVVIDTDKFGYITSEATERAVDGKRLKLVCVIHASNVTGALNDIEKIGAVAKRNNAIFMVDAAQSIGCVPIDVEKYGIDILAFPGHKGLLGPQGTGGLYIRDGLMIDSLTEGGTGSLSESLVQPEILPDRFESGTQNVPGIAGLSQGVKFVMKKGVRGIGEKERYLTKMLAEDLAAIRGVKIYGKPGSEMSVGVLSITTPMGSVELSDMLAKEYNIAVRAGLHCAPLAHRAIGTNEGGTVRFSPGVFTTREQIKFAARAVERCLK